MRLRTVATLMLLSGMCFAKEPKPSQSGTLLQMDSVSCGMAENSGKSLAGEIIGTDGAHKKTHELLCQEYLLQTDRVIYRIRPRDEKHPALLPVGERAQFRVEKDKIVLRVEDLDSKERDYTVVSMTRRDTTTNNDSSLSQK